MAKRIGHLELGQVLGVGGFGKVYLAHDLDLKQDYAVKVVDKALVRAHNLQEYVKREVDIMKMVRHKHVITLREVIELPNMYCLVMELAPNGELFDRIIESKRFDEATARRYFQQLMSAVTYCHRKGVVHRDLKAENLLLGENCELKVCDFGLSRFAFLPPAPALPGVQLKKPDSPTKDKTIVFTSLAGSTDYQAPEMWLDEGYQGYTCDIWSCGVILFFMLCGYLPFAARTDAETESRVRNGQYNKKDKHMSQQAADLISKILVPDPSKRATAEDIIAHPWFQKGLDPSLFPVEGSPAGGPRSADFRTPGASPDAGSPREDMDTDATAATELVQQLNKAFARCNTCHDGKMTRDELRDVLIELNEGKPVPEADVTSVMKCFVPADDPDAVVTQEQFVAGWATLEKRMAGKLPLSRLVNIFHTEVEQALLTDLRKAFKRLDVNDSGVITADNILAIPELKLNKEEARELIGAMARKKEKIRANSDKAAEDAKPRSPVEESAVPLVSRKDVPLPGTPATPGDKTTITFDDFVFACAQEDILRRHHVGTKLLRLQELFNAADQKYSLSYVNSGFTVAGLRNVIEEKILRESYAKCKTKFKVGETGAYLHGMVDPIDGKAGTALQVGVQLLPAAMGYTKVLSYRIMGQTHLFHEWFATFRLLLRSEIVACQEDTAAVGEVVEL